MQIQYTDVNDFRVSAVFFPQEYRHTMISLKLNLDNSKYNIAGNYYHF